METSLTLTDDERDALALSLNRMLELWVEGNVEDKCASFCLPHMVVLIAKLDRIGEAVRLERGLSDWIEASRGVFPARTISAMEGIHSSVTALVERPNLKAVTKDFYEVKSAGCGFYKGFLYPIQTDGYLDLNPDLAVHVEDMDMEYRLGLTDEECVELGIPRKR